jgi:hypothetical protein
LRVFVRYTDVDIRSSPLQASELIGSRVFIRNSEY